MPITPTIEQQETISLFRHGETMKITAYAGTGKTSGLIMIAKSSNKTGLYLSYNRSIALDAAKRFPEQITAVTINGMAYRAMRFRYSEEKLTTKMFPKKVAVLMALKVEYLGGIRISPEDQAWLTYRAVLKFCQSSDYAIGLHHIEDQPLFEYYTQKEITDLKSLILTLSLQYWAMAIDPESPLPLGHDGYLKIWALREDKKIGHYDYIMLDEAQDSNGVTLGLIQEMGIPCVFVGDPYQQIYEWRGAINAMDIIETPHAAYLTKSFRFCPELAEMATRVLACLGATKPLIGNSAVKYDPYYNGSFTYLSRSNGGVLASVVKLLEDGKRPHIVGGYQDIERLLYAVEALQKGEPVSEPEFFGLNSWEDIKDFASTDAGIELRQFVSLVSRHGPRRLHYILRQTAKTESGADAICSTIHRSKGREWDACMVEEDFRDPYRKLERKIKQLRPEDATGRMILHMALLAELRLLYVAITRSRVYVEKPDWVEDLLEEQTIEPEQTSPMIKVDPLRPILMQ